MANNRRIGVALVLSALDRASAVIDRMTTNAARRLEGLSKRTGAAADTSFKAGQQMAAAGVAVGAPVLGAVKAFATQEDAMLALQSTMMNAQGKISKSWERLNKLAIKLGDKLPGTTEDFYRLFETMIVNGAKAEDIINGTGRAAAYLAVQLRLPYNEAGELAQRLQVATGTSNRDMMKFMDTLARVKQLGPSVQEMQMAFQRSAGQLKVMKVQGLEATKQIANVYAILIKTMGSGERVGTGVAAVMAAFTNPKAMEKFNQVQKFFKDAQGKQLNMRFMDAQGEFLGVEHMMRQFDKMRQLSAPQRNSLINSLVGATGGDAQIIATLVDEGMAGYNKMQDAQRSQADLNMKVEKQLGSLKNGWDAISGTMTNVAASLGSTLKPEIDNIRQRIEVILPKVTGWIERNRTLVGIVMKAAVGFSALALAGGYMAFVFGGIMRGVSVVTKVFGGLMRGIKALQYAVFFLRYNFMFKMLPALQKVGSAFMVFGRALLTNPLTYYVLAAIAVGAAVYYIYKNWDKISAWFSEKWEAVKTVFGAVWDWMTGWVGRWYNAGANIVVSIAKGITDKVLLIKKVMGDVADKIRAYLPFSPAKEGALRDIHRIKLIETIAQGIKADAVLDKMRMVTERVRKVWDDGTSGLGIDTGNVLANVGMRAAGGGNVSVQTAPVQFNLTVNLNGSATKQDAERLGGMMQSEFEKMMDRYLRNKERVRY